MDQDDLRRIPRVKVCCRVDVRDRFGVWTAITEDICARGCRLVTAKAPRVSSVLEMRLSSDMFPEHLEISGAVAWASDHRVGVTFAPAVDGSHALTTAAWIERLVEHGRVLGPEPIGSASPRLVPAVRRPASGPRANPRPAQVVHHDDPEAGFPPLQHG